ncbi:hypothetical protein Pogu_2560 [Pyrobaculum oguniense TE7]|uniref:Uncharacterized protein n=1 Tax=Pyrobaculum oguniense (strain DSM 13380 / JCM 10595 / TE7) TaxID=698757 RepID=H6QBU4_PYROT|nr:hypothetical protein Pogu_2560 [Pyrobaculum oguniense TE7]
MMSDIVATFRSGADAISWCVGNRGTRGSRRGVGRVAAACLESGISASRRTSSVFGYADWGAAVFKDRRRRGQAAVCTAAFPGLRLNT